MLNKLWLLLLLYFLLMPKVWWFSAYTCSLRLSSPPNHGFPIIWGIPSLMIFQKNFFFPVEVLYLNPWLLVFSTRHSFALLVATLALRVTKLHLGCRHGGRSVTWTPNWTLSYAQSLITFLIQLVPPFWGPKPLSH